MGQPLQRPPYDISLPVFLKSDILKTCCRVGHYGLSSVLNRTYRRLANAIKTSTHLRNLIQDEHHAQAHFPTQFAAVAARFTASSYAWPPKPAPLFSTAAAPRAATRLPSPQASATSRAVTRNRSTARSWEHSLRARFCVRCAFCVQSRLSPSRPGQHFVEFAVTLP